jgi:hypothetical protein
MKNTANTRNITITNACTATATGTRTHGNCKPILCITTGEIFASLQDACEKYTITPSNLSHHLASQSKHSVCKGLQFCFVSKVQEHYDEITQQMREKTTVIMPKKVYVPQTKTATVVLTNPNPEQSRFRSGIIKMFKKFIVALEA